MGKKSLATFCGKYVCVCVAYVQCLKTEGAKPEDSSGLREGNMCLGASLGNEKKCKNIFLKFGKKKVDFRGSTED